MNKVRTLSTILLILFIAIAAYAHIRGPKNKRTGAPGEQICVDSDCHVDYEVNSGPGELTVLGVPKAYKPGEKYQITRRDRSDGVLR